MPDHSGVLIVDESGEYRTLISAVLLAQGHEVFEAGDASEAVEQLGRRHYAAILIDLKMPHDGVSLLEYLGTAMPHVLARTIVFVPWVNKPIWGTLTKPFHVDALVKAVTACATQ